MNVTLFWSACCIQFFRLQPTGRVVFPSSDKDTFVTAGSGVKLLLQRNIDRNLRVRNVAHQQLLKSVTMRIIR